MFDFYKSFQSNTKLAQDVATQISSASMEFTKTLVDANTRVANTVTEQFTQAYKNLETYKFPGFDTFAKTTSKKSAE